jgi:hypothetical protein
MFFQMGLDRHITDLPVGHINAYGIAAFAGDDGYRFI